MSPATFSPKLEISCARDMIRKSNGTETCFRSLFELRSRYPRPKTSTSRPPRPRRPDAAQAPSTTAGLGGSPAAPGGAAPPPRATRRARRGSRGPRRGLRPERANRQAGRGHDLREAHGGNAVLTKGARCGLQDPFACRFVVFRRVSHRCLVQLVSLLHLDHDLTFRLSSFNVGQRFIRRLEWKDLVHHRADVSSIDQSSNLSQLVAICFHEEKRKCGVEALCLSSRTKTQ